MAAGAAEIRRGRGLSRMMHVLRKYFRIWRCLALNSFRTQLSTSLASTGYFIGKILRLTFFLGYMVAIFRQTPGVSGYSMPQMVLFFMTFNLIDVGAQFLFRGLYGVKVLIEEGDFDKILTQPAHALFRISFMGMDLLDLLTLIPIGIISIWTLNQMPETITWTRGLFYLLMVANAIVIAYAFHVIVGALSVKTQEMESAIWIYRDVMTLGRFPVSIYSEWLRVLFVTALPIGVMITFPSEALLGMLSAKGAFYAIGLAAFFHMAAQIFWRRALKEYTSIST